MEEARAVLRRLDRIDRLERAGAAPTELLGEVRALLGEAERWARRDRADVDDTLDRCRDALASRGRELVDQPV